MRAFGGEKNKTKKINMLQKSGFVEIKVNERNIAFKFGMNAFGMFTEIHNVTLSQMQNMLEEGSISALRDIIYCAAYVAEKAAGHEVDFNKFTVGEWIDEMDEQDFELILKAVKSAKIMGKGVQEVTEKKSNPEEVDWDDLLSFGICELGLKPWEFWRLTFAEYNLMCEGYFIREAREWERTRYLAYCIIKTAPVEDKLNDVTDLMKLKTDPEDDIEYDDDYFKTSDEVKEMLDRLRKNN